MKLLLLLAVTLGFFCSTNLSICKYGAFNRFEKSVAGDLANWIFKDKCMGELGCFNNGAPFFDLRERPFSFLPWDRETINTHFLLYTRLNPQKPIQFSNLDRNTSDILQSKFQPESPIKIIVAGYISVWAPDWEVPLKDVLLLKENSNVFIVDWSGGDGPVYEQAVSNTRVVGAEIALFVEYLQNSTGANAEDVHIIGHSLGAHIAGYAGKIMKNIGRITGLDPAGPYFENVNPVVRLTGTDAVLVDVIHTNGASSRFKGFGTTESIGNLDFFPNGGSSQPGCPDLGPAVWEFLKNPSFKKESLFNIMCNHHRAIELFISSIRENHCDMTGVLCSTWEDFVNNNCGSCYGNSKGCVVMGYDAEKSWPLSVQNHVNVYLNTTDSPPYCQQE